MFFFDVITSQFDETSVLPVEVLITWLGSPRLLSWKSLVCLPSPLGLSLHYFTNIELNCSNDSFVFPKWQYLNYSDKIISINMLTNRRGIRKILVAWSFCLHPNFSLGEEFCFDDGFLEAVPLGIFQLKGNSGRVN